MLSSRLLPQKTIRLSSSPQLLFNFKRGFKAKTALTDESQHVTKLTQAEICKVPLTQPLPGLPQAIYPKVTSKNSETQITTLQNGLKVASEKRFGKFCIVGVAVRAGSRFEDNYVNGISHFVERSAFKSTTKYSSRQHILEMLAPKGGTIDCQGARDLQLYAVSIMNGGNNVDMAVELLGDSILRPRFTDDEMRETGNQINFEIQDMSIDPERKQQLNDLLHSAAYGNSSLGLPRICPPENLDLMNRDMLFEYLKNSYRPDQMVLAGVGVEHDRLVDLAQKYFVDTPPVWQSFTSFLQEDLKTTMKPEALYTGGMKLIKEDLSKVSLGPTPLPNLVHFQLGLEVCSHLDLDEFVIVCVTNMLMGGGGSFSAGGPGKGMFTRLFIHVLNRYHWVHSSAAHNASYEDTGLFFIQSSCDPSELKNLVDIVIHEFRNLVHGPMFQDELNRAKKQLISMLLLNLEIRPVVFEDIARQVLSTGFRRQPQQLIDKIERVTEDDIRRVAAKMLTKNPSVACLGDLTNIPPFDYIKSRLAAKP